MDIKEFIKSKRATLSDSSVKTYASILRSLYNKVFTKGDTYDYEKFSDVKPIKEFLDPLPPNKRKTILSALVVITGLPVYKNMMEKDVKEYASEIAKQEPTEAQAEAWVEPKDIDKVFNEYEKNAKLLMKKPNITPADLQEIQNFIILALVSGKLTPARRAKDWVDFKIKNATENDNYIEGNNLVFNSYKTAFSYGQQKEKMSIKLKNILKKWIEINPTDYLLFDSNMNPLSSVKLNQRLNKIFGGKKVGINAIRHSVLTQEFAETIPLKKKIAEKMSAMASSPAMLTTYVKDITKPKKEKKVKEGELSETAKAFVKEQNKKWDAKRKPPPLIIEEDDE